MDDDLTSRVLVVLVAHDGAEWLPECLRGLAAQDHPALEVVAVDNGSRDGSGELLAAHLGESRVLVAERDLGFGQAVSMALDAVPASSTDHLMFLHDDCVLEPHAVSTLVAALDGDDRLAMVGPKLVDYSEPSRLQSVGWTVDITGRADSELEEDELDQGQRDQVRAVLYVSTACMLVRRQVFDTIGRFDRRYHLFRDDLDLCWRAWLAGHAVEVVPSAVARHVAGAANYRRLGQTAFLGPRYFAERNTLATLLKNYGAARLAYVLPLFFIVGVAKVLGFVATRRVSDAWQTVRAWLWNGYYLPRTLRLRRRAQALRERRDGELRALFGRIGPRARAYGEAVGDWIAGPERAAEVEPQPLRPVQPRTARQRLVAYTRARPVLVSGFVLTVVSLLLAVPLLGPGELRGGQLAPWPAAAGAFLADYAASWHHATGVGTHQAPSPAQAVLGVLDLLAGGNSWLAPRLLLLAPFPVAWLLALRAGAAISPHRLPRIAAATAYVLSPPALAALRTGRVGTLVTLVALPGLAAAYRSVMRTDSGQAPGSAWRATASAILVAGVMIAFEPGTAVAFGVWIVVALLGVAVLSVPRRLRRDIAVRVLVTGIGPALLLLPWSTQLILADGPLRSPARSLASIDVQPFLRWLTMTPDLDGFPGVAAGVGFVLAGLLGIVYGFRRRPASVIALWVTAFAGVFSAWQLGRSTAPTAWPGLPLLLTAAAFAGLLAIAFARAESILGAHDFGWRQIGAGVTGLAVVLGLLASAAGMLTDPWSAYARGVGALPEFIPAQQDATGPFRVLVLAERDGVVEWELTGGDGPSMAGFGGGSSGPLLDAVDGAVTDVVERRDPGAASDLGLRNVAYVVVPSGASSDDLDGALADQLALEPQPVATGAVYRVGGWLPRAAVLDDTAVTAVEERGELPADAELESLPARNNGAYVAEMADGEHLLLSEGGAGGWVAQGQEGRLDRSELAGIARFEAEDDGRVVLAHAGGAGRTTVVVLQLFGVLLVVSLMLRPPRFARTGEVRGEGPGAAGADGGHDGQPRQPGDVPDGLRRDSGDLVGEARR